MEFKRIAIDTSKQVFTLHGVDQTDRPVLRRNLGRAQMEKFFAQQAPTEVVMEACGSAHHWGRTLQAMGHRVRLLPPQYVKRSSSAARTTATTPRRSARPRAARACAACRSSRPSARPRRCC